jgi:hypothetical protein
MRKGSFEVYGIHQEGHVLVFDVLAQNFRTNSGQIYGNVFTFRSDFQKSCVEYLYAAIDTCKHFSTCELVLR